MTDDELELEAEHSKTMHILNMGEAGKGGLCKEKCGDVVCDAGCLRQKAKLFRPHIMHGIHLLRETGSGRYPLNAKPALGEKHKCTPARHANDSDKFCRDPVCCVTGCLDQPAWQFRELIKIALEQELGRSAHVIISALKK